MTLSSVTTRPSRNIYLHLIAALFFVCFAGLTAAYAEPTEITVRVVSKDAKFIGTSVGSMRVILRDSQTGEILASGLTSGGTGDTKRIMHKDAGRRAILSDPSTAKFVATLDLSEPRLIEVEALVHWHRSSPPIVSCRANGSCRAVASPAATVGFLNCPVWWSMSWIRRRISNCHHRSRRSMCVPMS